MLESLTTALRSAALRVEGHKNALELMIQQARWANERAERAEAEIQRLNTLVAFRHEQTERIVIEEAAATKAHKEARARAEAELKALLEGK